MITIEQPNTVVASGIKDTVSFGIKQDGLAHIFSVLRNQLYSDKILAVIREYSCNAVDAHVEAGKADLPIIVTMPTHSNPVLKIRDFGLGLTDEDIHEIYAFYGESTKRKSNAMIGQLGLGSKSAFAYGDNFVITSFVNGVKSTYNAFIDVSQIGQIAKLCSEPTNEENGVEIAISVRGGDIHTFHSKACTLFRYFRVRPTVKNANFTYETHKPIMEGADWRIIGKSQPSVAIMGNIGYPIDNHWNDANVTNLLSCGVEVDFNIGDLEISASREKLQYTDRTKKAIFDKLQAIVKEVVAELNKRFASCKTLFDAHKLYGTVMDYGSELYLFRNLLVANLTFNGKRITSNDIRFSESPDGGYSVRQFESTWRGNKVKSYSYNMIDCTNQTVLIDNDLKITSGIVNRVWNLVKVDGKKVYLFSYRDDAEKAKFLAESGLVQENFILLSSLPKISLSSATGAAPKNAKHQSKEFSFDANFQGGRYHRRNSDYWQKETLDVANDAGLYVIIDKFMFRDQKGRMVEPDELGDVLKSLAAFGIKIDKVYGLKQAKEDTVKANANMVCLWDYIAKELTEFFVKNKTAQKVANRIEYDRFVGAGFNWSDFLLHFAKKVSVKTEFAQFAEKVKYMSHAADKAILDAAVSWSEYFTSTEKPEHDLCDLGKNISAKYPLFQFIRYWENGQIQVDSTIQYINLIDG